MPDSDKHSRLNVAILDDSIGICASSTPVTCGGYFPKFFSPTVDPPSPILPSAPAPSHQPPPSSTPAVPLPQPPTSSIPSCQPPSSSTPVIPSQPLPPNHRAKTMSLKLRQKKAHQKGQQETFTTAIVVEDCGLPSEQCEEQWVGGLTKKDQAIISTNGWLTDNIVNTAQGLLKQQYPHINGFQNVVLGLTLSYTVQTEEFIQVLHTGHGHWVTVSTVGCKDGEINIYDSLPPAPTSHLMNQIAALLATPKPAITVKYMDTQMQCGSTDCGIFAIAFATALANGEQPGGLHFEQPQMRKHLMHCLEAQCLSGFPVTRRRRAARVKLSSSLHVYCSCRMPEQAGSTMIQCSMCKEWFHVGVCVDVPIQAFDSATKWFCNKCI